MDSPFQFGTQATEKIFIDRVEERAELKQMLSLSGKTAAWLFLIPFFLLWYKTL